MKIEWREVKLDEIVKRYVEQLKLQDGESLFSFRAYGLGANGDVAIKLYINEAPPAQMVAPLTATPRPCHGGFWCVPEDGPGPLEGVCSVCWEPASCHPMWVTA